MNKSYLDSTNAQGSLNLTLEWAGILPSMRPSETTRRNNPQPSLTKDILNLTAIPADKYDGKYYNVQLTWCRLWFTSHKPQYPVSQSVLDKESTTNGLNGEVGARHIWLNGAAKWGVEDSKYRWGEHDGETKSPWGWHLNVRSPS